MSDRAVLASKITLGEVMRPYSTIRIHPVWKAGDLSVVLLRSSLGKLGGCGILLWGCQFENSIECIAIKTQELEAKFRIFDGQSGGHSFSIINGHRTDWRAFVESLKTACEKADIYRIFAKNAKLLECGGVLWAMTEEIENFYMRIARSDGTLIPEFDFINPQASSAFWSNNG